jgi:hypothetical protein
MTPFEVFRLWLRRAPTTERTASAVVGAIVLSLVVFILLPVTTNDDSDPDGTAVTSGGPISAAGQQEATPAVTEGGIEAAPSGMTSGTVAGRVESIETTASGTVATAGGSAQAGCTSPPGSDQGVSGNEVHIAVTVLNVVGPSGNAAFGVPSADEQRQDYELAINDLNKRGGAACRKLVAKFYTVNPADEDNQKATCLDIVSSKVFAVIDAGGYYGTAAANCFPQNQIPFMGSGSLAPEQRDQFYPYLFGTGDYAALYRNGVLAFNDAGFFSKEPTFKLGWVYRDCWASLVTHVRNLLNQVGVKQSQIVEYDLGCPTGGFASPADIQQAILKFQSERVTHVIESQAYDDVANFTNVAQSQGFKPRYAMLDQEMIPTSQGTLHVNYDNVDGALIVTSDRYGDETSGIAPNAATRRCDALAAAAGKPPTYKQKVGFGGVACSQIWAFTAALEHAPALQRKSLAAGLQAAKSIETAYPRGPVDWSGPKTTSGGQFWRLQTFQKACTCWKVTDAAFRPAFR